MSSEGKHIMLSAVDVLLVLRKCMITRLECLLASSRIRQRRVLMWKWWASWAQATTPWSAWPWLALLQLLRPWSKNPFPALLISKSSGIPNTWKTKQEARHIRENGHDVLPVLLFLEGFLMKKMRMCFPREKTFADGFGEYILDCKARNLRDGR